MTAWTAEMNDALRQHLAETRSYSRICEEMNRKFNTDLTRSAVAGRVMRLGLAVPRPIGEKPAAPVKARTVTLTDKVVPMPAALVKPGRQPRVARVPLFNQGAMHPERPTPAPQAMIAAPEAIPVDCTPVPGGVLLVDLSRKACHFPINNGNPFRFCGAPGFLDYPDAKIESPYCLRHTLIARGADASGKFDRWKVEIQKFEAVPA